MGVACAALVAAGCDDDPSGRGEAGVPRDSAADVSDAAMVDQRAADAAVADARPDVPAVCERLAPCCQRYGNPEFIPYCEAVAANGPAEACAPEIQGDPRVRLCATGAERDACMRLSRDCCPRLPAALRQDCERYVADNDPVLCVDRLASHEACADLIYPPDAGP